MFHTLPARPWRARRRRSRRCSAWSGAGAIAGASTASPSPSSPVAIGSDSDSPCGCLMLPRRGSERVATGRSIRGRWSRSASHPRVGRCAAAWSFAALPAETAIAWRSASKSGRPRKEGCGSWSPSSLLGRRSGGRSGRAPAGQATQASYRGCAARFSMSANCCGLQPVDNGRYESWFSGWPEARMARRPEERTRPDTVRGRSAVFSNLSP